ncbi:hypothetical protein AU196_14995 [Mycobacterium sp. IS-1742]|uniref:SAM-dependent methyltransferase n=1 Tax=Mycobacterium sp. IS-1742 TaxID=1772285 RepID=UPI00073FAE4E|nr:SAM-dependent methyltransferase [Mycobacterium sp. IS-1742]KUI24642.1 hypothetical protein AU196_14995 [Mycobacterium sp. IS-1742]
MTRTGHDDWDVSESVGATAIATAVARAREAGFPEPLFADPYAQMFLDAAMQRGAASQFGAVLAGVHDDDPLAWRRLEALWDYIAARTRWFDDQVLAAGESGVPQVVVLGAGLDARAWRLPRPPGSVVFEIDQPAVLAFKNAVLDERGVVPAEPYVPVPVDLRDEWCDPLCQAGFDPRRATLWLAEGLLVYFSGAEQDQLMNRLDGLSAPGSRIAVDVLTPEFFEPTNLALIKDRFDQGRAAAARSGGEFPDASALWVVDERADVADWLAGRGWTVDVVDVRDAMGGYGRKADDDVADVVPRSAFISGRR